MYTDGGGLPCMNHQTILTIEILFEKLVYTLKSDVFCERSFFLLGQNAYLFRIWKCMASWQVWTLWFYGGQDWQVLKSCHFVEKKGFGEGHPCHLQNWAHATYHDAALCWGHSNWTFSCGHLHSACNGIGRDRYALKKAGLKWSYKQQTNMFHI